jgi:hypothetical protein
LVDSVENMMMHGLANPKFKNGRMYFCSVERRQEEIVKQK